MRQNKGVRASTVRVCSRAETGQLIGLSQPSLLLLLWLRAGLDEAQRAGVLDSFIGWTLYAEQLGRRELHELCVHAMARHWAAAQSRWAVG